MRRGNSHYYCDSRRPELVNRMNTTRFSRRALVAYGFYNTAVEMTMRDRDRVH